MCFSRLSLSSLVAAASVLCVSQTVHAESVTLSTVFGTTNASMWGTNAPAFAFKYEKSFSVPLTGSASPGSIDCGPLGLVCGGVEVHATTSGSFGMGVEIGVTSGAVTANLPVDLGLNYSPVASASQGVVVSSSAIFGQGDLITQSPSVYGVIGMDLTLHASVNATGCLVVGPLGDCDTLGKVFDINLHPDLLSFNKNNDGDLKILGISRPLTFDTTYIDVTVKPPSIGLSAHGLPPLEGTGSASFIDLEANAVNVATTALGLPPFSGHIGALDYNLLSAGLGLDVGITQAVKLQTPTVTVRLDVAETGKQYSFEAGTQSPTIDFLGHDALTITPTFTVSASFVNDMGLALTPFLFANGGSFGVFGLDVGPLFNKQLNFADPLLVDVFDNAFMLGGFAPIVGQSFTVSATADDPAVPEPATLSLLGGGLALAAWRRRRRQ